MKKSVLWWFLGIAGLHLLSWSTIFSPGWNFLVSIMIGWTVFMIAMYRPTSALVILAVEYLIGSKGALFKIGGDASNDGGIAIRIILFAAFMAGWFIWSLWHKTWRTWGEYLRGRWAYVILAIVLVYALAIGITRHNPFVLADANAWGIWLLLLPVLDLARHESVRLKRDVVPAFIAAMLWTTAFTMALFFIFTHGFAEVGGSSYLWIRRTGLGEITDYGQGLHRIFFQSHVYAVFVLIGCFIGSLFTEKKMVRSWLYVGGLLSLLQIFISLSRSLWLGTGVGLLAAFIIGLLLQKNSSLWKRLSKSVMHGIVWLGVFIVSIVVAGLVYSIPPNKIQPKAPFTQFFLSRTDTQEAAAISRYQLLPILWNKVKEHPVLGSGFGATVTYQTKDPRIVARTGGVYTTYAFEWGWLDHWIKFGLIGIPLVLFLLGSLGYRSIMTRKLWAQAGIPASLFALAIIHLFSPYLNHPLGIAALIAGEGWLALKRE